MELKDFIALFNGPEKFVAAHTSGSTGCPKTIHLSKADMLRSARASNIRFGITADSRLLCPLSLDYIAGKMMAVRAIAAGCALEMMAPNNTLKLDNSFVERPADLLPIVPSMGESLLDDPQLHLKVRQILIGGGAATEKLCASLSRLGITVWLSYGMTETCSHVALARGDEAERVYKAMPGISFSTTAEGQLIIEAPEFEFKRIVANDIVELIDSTSFRWLGRSDGVINSGGIKLIPERLEAMYRPILPEGTVFYVRGRSDSKWGQAVEVVVEDKTGLGAAGIADLFFNSTLPGTMRPKYITVVPKIPLTPSGKIRRLG